MRRAQQQAITFTAINATTGAVMTGLTFPAGEVQISKDVGAFANVAGAVTELGLGVYTVTLSAAETDARWLHFAVRHTNMRPVDWPSGYTTGNPSFKVVDDPANTATTFKTDRTETADDYWVSAGVQCTSGSLQGQVREVAAYNGTTKFITLDLALTAEPAADTYFNLLSE
jgi:hypothetical protein